MRKILYFLQMGGVQTHLITINWLLVNSAKKSITKDPNANTFMTFRNYVKEKKQKYLKEKP